VTLLNSTFRFAILRGRSGGGVNASCCWPVAPRAS